MSMLFQAADACSGSFHSAISRFTFHMISSIVTQDQASRFNNMSIDQQETIRTQSQPSRFNDMSVDQQESDIPQAVNSATLILRPQLAVDAGIPFLDDEGPDHTQPPQSTEEQTWPWRLETEDWEELDCLERDCLYDFYVRCRNLFVSGNQLVNFLNGRCEALYYTVPAIRDGIHGFAAEKRAPEADLRYDAELLRLQQRIEELVGRCDDFLHEKVGNRTGREAVQDATVGAFLFRADRWHKAKILYMRQWLQMWRDIALTAEETHDELTAKGTWGSAQSATPY